MPYSPKDVTESVTQRPPVKITAERSMENTKAVQDNISKQASENVMESVTQNVPKGGL